MKKVFLGTLLALGASVGLVWAGPETMSAPPPPLDAPPAAPCAPVVEFTPSRPLWGQLPGPHEAITEAPALPTEFASRDESGAGDPSTGRLYARVEYLLWWLKPDHVPPLVTTGPAAIPTAILGASTTTTLFGGNLNNGSDSGVRLTLGAWLDDCHQCGIEISGFILGTNGRGHSFNSAEFPVLARPFFNVNTGMADTEVAAFPGVATGSISVSNHGTLGGGNADLSHEVCCGCWYRVDLIAGLCYLRLDEDLTITEQGVDTNSPLLPPQLQNASFLNIDQFHTRNEFYGGEVGAKGEVRWGKVFLDARGTVALGNTHETLDISGGQQVVGPTGVSIFTGGLLALPSNIGHFTQDHFAVVPEAEFDLGYQITEHLRVFVGYDFIYWSRLLRPGEQIDTNLDVSQIPNGPTGVPSAGRTQPAVLFHQSDFWAQGLNLGVEMHY